MSIEDKVNEILGIDESKTPVVKKQFTPPIERKKGENDIDSDYDYSRESYYNLIQKGQEAIDGILDIAKEGEHPRAYEVAGQLIGQVAGTVDKLQDLQKKLKELKAVPKSASANIKNALFVGSTADLQKMLKKNNEDIKSKTITPEEKDISDK